MILQRLRGVGLVGAGAFFGCIYPVILIIAGIGVSWGLWNALGWPSWILWIGLALLFFNLDTVFFIMMLAAFVAGFFGKAWPWSLAVAGLLVFSFGVSALLGLLDKSISRDEA